MKIITSFIFILFFLITTTGCEQEIREESPQLSDLQIAACNSAEKGNTCDTKLNELSIVTKEQCCSFLGKCC